MIAREPQTATRVALRPLRPEDLPRVHRWRTDPVSARFCGWNRPELSAPGRIEALYLPAIMDPEGADAWHFVIEAPDGLAGLITYDRVDRHNQSCRLFLLIGETGAWGRGLGTEALRRILSLLFDAAGMHRVFVEVNAENERALHCLRRAGFREEGRLRDAERFEGRWVDVVVLSVLAHDFRRHEEPRAWEITPLCPEEEDWFERLGLEAACDPWEIPRALNEDEILVWRRDGQAAAYCALAWRADEVEIHILAVDPQFRRQGLATEMLNAVRERARARGIHRVVLVTSNDNYPAITLYQRAGFRMTNLFVNRLEARRGHVRYGLCGIPIRDDIELTWDV